MIGRTRHHPRCSQAILAAHGHVFVANLRTPNGHKRPGRASRRPPGSGNPPLPASLEPTVDPPLRHWRRQRATAGGPAGRAVLDERQQPIPAPGEPPATRPRARHDTDGLGDPALDQLGVERIGPAGTGEHQVDVEFAGVDAMRPSDAAHQVGPRPIVPGTAAHNDQPATAAAAAPAATTTLACEPLSPATRLSNVARSAGAIRERATDRSAHASAAYASWCVGHTPATSSIRSLSLLLRQRHAPMMSRRTGRGRDAGLQFPHPETSRRMSNGFPDHNRRPSARRIHITHVRHGSAPACSAVLRFISTDT